MQIDDDRTNMKEARKEMWPPCDHTEFYQKYDARVYDDVSGIWSL